MDTRLRRDGWQSQRSLDDARPAIEVLEDWRAFVIRGILTTFVQLWPRRGRGQLGEAFVTLARRGGSKMMIVVLNVEISSSAHQRGTGSCYQWCKMLEVKFAG